MVKNSPLLIQELPTYINNFRNPSTSTERKQKKVQGCSNVSVKQMNHK